MCIPISLQNPNIRVLKKKVMDLNNETRESKLRLKLKGGYLSECIGVVRKLVEYLDGVNSGKWVVMWGLVGVPKFRGKAEKNYRGES